jgi:hypothetical protein
MPPPWGVTAAADDTAATVATVASTAVARSEVEMSDMPGEYTGMGRAA